MNNDRPDLKKLIDYRKELNRKIKSVLGPEIYLHQCSDTQGKNIVQKSPSDIKIIQDQKIQKNSKNTFEIQSLKAKIKRLQYTNAQIQKKNQLWNKIKQLIIYMNLHQNFQVNQMCTDQDLVASFKQHVYRLIQKQRNSSKKQIEVGNNALNDQVENSNKKINCCEQTIAQLEKQVMDIIKSNFETRKDSADLSFVDQKDCQNLYELTQNLISLEGEFKRLIEHRDGNIQKSMNKTYESKSKEIEKLRQKCKIFEKKNLQLEKDNEIKDQKLVKTKMVLKEARKINNESIKELLQMDAKQQRLATQTNACVNQYQLNTRRKDFVASNERFKIVRSKKKLMKGTDDYMIATSTRRPALLSRR